MINPLISPLPSAAPAVAWYCLRVMARREQITARNLEQRTGAAAFAPAFPVSRTTAGGLMVKATEALFPGYIFARFDYPHEARHVGSTPGVLALVTFGGPPPKVSDEVIAQIAAEVGRADAPVEAAPFPAGATIRVTAGCFRGHEGRVLHTAPASARISVLLHLLGQDVQVSLPGSQLQDAAGPSQVPAGLRAGAVRPAACIR